MTHSSRSIKVKPFNRLNHQSSKTFESIQHHAPNLCSCLLSLAWLIGVFQAAFVRWGWQRWVHKWRFCICRGTASASCIYSSLPLASAFLPPLLLLSSILKLVFKANNCLFNLSTLHIFGNNASNNIIIFHCIPRCFIAILHFYCIVHMYFCCTLIFCNLPWVLMRMRDCKWSK